jgi:hypothetical protein
LFSSDFVVLEYADGLIHKLRPNQLKEFYLKPRFSKLDEYEGKTHMEAGMEVRLRWDKRHDKCEVILIGNDISSQKMDELFELLDGERKTKVLYVAF